LLTELSLPMVGQTNQTKSRDLIVFSTLIGLTNISKTGRLRHTP
jgi:hypothetical protein